ncbi:MAG: hypothetical protein IT285_09030 [Bdellovibrionales bacterium]|nr:hypothetical protein [Bdellovibrionales bacterium]
MRTTNGWIPTGTGAALLAALWTFLSGTGAETLAADPGETIVYGVYRPVDLGGEQPPPKDYYVSMGTRNGVQKGTTLQVFRKMATHDLVSKRHQVDLMVPVATLKVVHAEGSAAVARLDKFFPEDEAPSIGPRAVMIGDFVQVSR